jgi:hypothetical protein
MMEDSILKEFILAPSSEVKYYEGHITLPLEQTFIDSARQLVPLTKWKWSQIDGDEVMGPGKRAYLTRSMGSAKSLAEEMLNLCNYLTSIDVVWERRKIEAIIVDERSRP